MRDHGLRVNNRMDWWGPKRSLKDVIVPRACPTDITFDEDGVEGDNFNNWPFTFDSHCAFFDIDA